MNIESQLNHSAFMSQFCFLIEKINTANQSTGACETQARAGFFQSECDTLTLAHLPAVSSLSHCYGCMRSQGTLVHLVLKLWKPDVNSQQGKSGSLKDGN